MTFRPGLRIAEKYKLLRRLGAGALGEVWCARNDVVEREVAIKFIAPAWALDQVAIDRFFADAKQSGKLRHPSIVELLDLGRTGSGVPYTVMELLEADKLDDVLARVESLPTGTSLRIVGELARALAAAHEKKLPHLRIEPANVLLHRVQRSPKNVDVVPKLVDFGIARLVQAAPARAKRIDDLLGPIAYLSPEQTREGEIVDLRADIWGLGVLLYHCMVGALPFAAKTIGELAAAHKSPCVAPNVIDPSIDATVSHLVMECISSREKRPTARRLADRIDELLRRFDDAWGDLATVLEIPDDRLVSKIAAIDPESIVDEGATPSLRRVITQPILDEPPPPDEEAPISSSALEEVPPSSGDEAVPVSTRDFVHVQQGASHRPPHPAPSNAPMPLVTRVAPRVQDAGDAQVPQIIQRLSAPDSSDAALLDELEAALLERVAVQRASQLPEVPKPEAETPVAPPPEDGLFGPKAIIVPQPVLFSSKPPRREEDTTSPGQRVPAMPTMPPMRRKPPILPIAIGVVAVGLIAFAVASPKKREPVTPAPEATSAAAPPTPSPAPTESELPTTTATETATENVEAIEAPAESSSAAPPPTTMITANPKPKPTATPTIAKTPTPKPTVTTVTTTKPTTTTKPKDPFYGVDNSGI